MDNLKPFIDAGFAGLSVLLLYMLYSETREVINLLKFMLESNTMGLHKLAESIDKLERTLSKRPCLFKEDI